MGSRPEGPGLGMREVGRPSQREAWAATQGKDIAAGARPPRWGPGLARPPPPPPPPARPQICSRQTRRCPPDGSARTACSGPWLGLSARSAGSAPGPTSAPLHSEPARARGREAAARHLLHLLRAPPLPAHFRPTPEPEVPVVGAEPVAAGLESLVNVLGNALGSRPDCPRSDSLRGALAVPSQDRAPSPREA